MKIDSITRDTVLAALQDSASDDEAETIERLAIKVGFWWKCSLGECNFVNPAEESICDGCGKARVMP